MTEHAQPIVVVGSINMDLVASVPRIPVPGQTLVGTDFVTTPGGKGANQAVAIARLGFSVRMIGAVGADVFGQSLLDTLEAAGVETEAVARVEGPSGIAQIAVTHEGQNSIIVVSGANGKVTPAFVQERAELLRGAGMVLCQLELPIETVASTLEICAQAGVPVMLDPAPAADLPEQVWKQVTWFTPNETEMALYLWGIPSPEDAAKRLLGTGLRGVVLKCGSQGAYVAVAGDARWVPAFSVEAVDTVAAGDCFNGAFAVGLLEGHAPWSAARFASAAAAISVTRRGAQASMPTRAEVDAFILSQG
jgi:ribokinase